MKLSVNLLIKKAKIWMKLENYLMALQDFDKVLEMSEIMPECCFLKGLCLFHLTRYSEAILSFE
jgi:hypothetical protein